ncbi:MAG: ATP-binding protein, partial [bacterium]
RLATRFNLTGEQITRVCEQASRTAFARDPEKSRLQLSDLFECSRTISQPRLTTLSRKIKPAYNWDDLVLPLDQLAHLKEIARQVKNKRVVMEEMGFGKKLSLGRGISALFSGQSGTGKTMAAEIIANDLGLDMYKIDLSAVVSKYIGETEKNLNRVFTEAEYSNAILFFDEADALLGKRSEVKDAHDRFANIEIAYLLQKMEEYEGVVIMATNLKKNIDDAFVRRIQFIVDFPFPNEVYREAIWRAVYPKETNLHKEIDFGFLAGKFVFAGGNIKNVALRAAYLAAEDGQVVTMKHLVQATRRELQKIGKSFTIGDFGQYTNVLK